MLGGRHPSSASRCAALLVATLALAAISAAAQPSPARAFSVQCSDAGIACIKVSGYSGRSVWGYPVDSRGNNCTNYAAYRLSKNGAGNPGNLGNAGSWAANARAKGIRVDGTPVAGAIAQWNRGSGYTRGAGANDFGHVAYVESVSGSTIKLSDSNYALGSKRWTVSKGDRQWPSNFIHLKDLKPPPPAEDPRGNFEAASSPAAGKVSVRGWAFDPSAKTTSLTIHVFVGGIAGKGEGHDIGKASVSRPDVARAFPGVGSKHGFSTSFTTKRYGSQQVCAYALNVGSGANKLLDCRTVTVPDPAPPGKGDSTGYYESGPAGWHLRNALSDGPSNYIFARGNPGTVPLVGDWDGDGRDSTGFYDPAAAGFHLSNALAPGASNYIFSRGEPNSIPLVGDWDGDGKDSTGVYYPWDQSFHLSNALAPGASNYILKRGSPNAIPLAGDWDGDGKDSTGVYYPWDQSFHLRNELSDGASQYIFKRGAPNSIPLVGDWNGDGKDSTGAYYPWDQSWHLSDALADGSSNYAFVRGSSGAVPVVGNWDGK